jgi:hypothetical protein
MLTFVNVDNNVFIYRDQPSYNATTGTTTYVDLTTITDSTKGVAMTDLDGSITGAWMCPLVGSCEIAIDRRHVR